MPSPTIVDSVKKKSFLLAFAECGNVTKAAEIAGCARQSHYEWLAESAEYKQLFEQAKESAADRLEQEARRRAVEGISEPVYYQGKCV